MDLNWIRLQLYCKDKFEVLVRIKTNHTGGETERLHRILQSKEAKGLDKIGTKHAVDSWLLTAERCFV
jgi:hypothetical protein